MFAQIIELKNINDEVENKIEEAMATFICSLKNNGQISFEHKTVANNQGYDICVSTPKSDSLDSCYDSIFVSRDRDIK